MWLALELIVAEVYALYFLHVCLFDSETMSRFTSIEVV